MYTYDNWNASMILSDKKLTYDVYVSDITVESDEITANETILNETIPKRKKL